MIIKKETNIRDFKAWSGAVNTLNRIIEEGKDEELESLLEEMYPEGLTETELNDLLWFENDQIFEWLDIKTQDDINAEIEDLKDKIRELEEEYEEEAEDLQGEDKQELWEQYKGQIEDLEKQIEELEEELEGF